MALMRAQLRQFTAADLDEAGRLLSARHRRHREHQPLLARRFEDAEAATAQVAAIWQGDGASGSVAITGGRVVGYLLGSVMPSPVWGPNVWVEAAGQAVHGDAEVMRDLYGAAAARWVEEGRTAHIVLVPAYDPGLAAAWFRLGFGHQHTHAVRLPQHEPVAPRDGVRIRRAARADIPVLGRLELELPRHQSRSPCFSAGDASTLEETLAEWEADFADPDYAPFVAEHQGRVIGHAVGCALTKSRANTGLIRPDNAGFLGFAAVLPEGRGLGAGRAVGETVLAWSATAG